MTTDLERSVYRRIEVVKELSEGEVTPPRGTGFVEEAFAFYVGRVGVVGKICLISVESMASSI